ncbi:hypothetical protein F5Y09DRAFT_342243 [Xylaria sp. FL1042]|nr:hypothetical protein F5Y09DRAFT_342243 [Xylaria sp. FL1042]
MERQYTNANRSYQYPSETELPTEQKLLILTIISLLIDCIMVAFVFGLFFFTCFRHWYRGRRSQRNPESQRAEELLNSPRQPVDPELAVIHARSPPHWPLTDGIEIQTTTPDNYYMKGKVIYAGTSPYYFMHSNRARVTRLNPSGLSVVVEGLDIADTDSDHSTGMPPPQAEEFSLGPYADHRTNFSTASIDMGKNVTEDSDQDAASLTSTACGSDVTSNRSEQFSTMSDTTVAPSHAIGTHETESIDNDSHGDFIAEGPANHTH